MKQPFEIILFLLFVAYIVLRPESPPIMTDIIDTPIGTLLVIVITAYLFLYTHPVLGILSLFVAYEVLRRNNRMTLSMVKYTVVEPPKTGMEMPEVAPKEDRTLEEDVIDKMSPLMVSLDIKGVNYTPTAEHVHNASPFNE